MVAAPQNYNLNYSSAIQQQPLMSSQQYGQVTGNFNNAGKLPVGQSPFLAQLGGPAQSQLLQQLQAEAAPANQQSLGNFGTAYSPANQQYQFNTQQAQAGLGNQAYQYLLGRQNSAFDQGQSYRSLLLNGMGGMIPGLGSLLGGGGIGGY